MSGSGKIKIRNIDFDENVLQMNITDICLSDITFLC